MKRLLLIISLIFSLTGMLAQTSDGYLTDGDIVSISVLSDENGIKRYYLEASTDGLLTKEYATKECLWKLGITENNGNYTYTLQDMTTNKYLNIAENPSNPSYSLVDNPPTALTFNRLNGDNRPGICEYGTLYYHFYYSQWSSWRTIYIGQTNWWPFRFGVSADNPANLYIEKWQQEGADAPQGGFSPETILFSYAADNDEAQKQTQSVTFTIPETAITSYKCLNRPDEIIGGGQNDVNEGDITDFHLYWESSNNDISTIIPANYYDDPNDAYTLPAEGTQMFTLTPGASAGSNKTHTFTITPVGESPMNLRTNTNNRIQWVNYADRVVAEYKYKGNIVKQTMRVVRNSYHEEALPPLVFHINPTVFNFGQEKETVNISVVPIHQHGRVIYDVNQNIFKTEYEEHTPAYPEHLSLTSPTDGWVITTDDGADWLEHTMNGNTIAITAEALGSGQSDRTATFTGTFKREKADGNGHDHEESFTIKLNQRGDAGIQFVRKGQNVHTATRTIYYLPGEQIELRLAESNFFGYMRWYDYHTGKAPNYNFGKDDPTYGDYNYATSWYTTPRGANNQPFTPINTPQNTATESTEGRSWGLYAINHYHGGILNEANENSNNTPVLNGWNYNYTQGNTYTEESSKRAAGYHTIACDVSAYTDYDITTENGLVKKITEPTLSYRQLFDLRPAGEMADKFAALEGDRYLEEYHYQAPAGKNVLLTPQFKYRKGTDQYMSKLCYFYWNGNQPARVTDARWEGDGRIADNGEYLTISGNAGQTKIYTLTANNGTLRIAKFTVTFTDPQVTGPSKIVLKSKQEMMNHYSLIEHIDFNYTDESKKIKLSDGNTYYNQPLNWTESTYGYVYPAGALAQEATNNHHGYVRAAGQGVFPFYGEYCLVNNVSKQWGAAAVQAEQHGGKDNGFALYVDGTTEPGLVASIAANVTICSGQTMYCSAWLCNPSNSQHSGSNPIFRCNIQGRNSDQEEWQDAGVFFVGELQKGSGWQQIVFPIQSASSYTQTRVSIYNFATSGAANDFLVDDISLFVSQLPIAAYQGKMACRTIDDHTSAAAVLRLDYSNINAGSDGYMFYQIYNESYENKGAPVNLTGNAAYYHDYDVDHDDNDHDHPYGSIHIPEKNYVPNNEDLQFLSVSKFLDYLAESGERHGKAYIQTTNDGASKWLLYVAHIIEQVQEGDVEKDSDLPLEKLYDRHEYTMRMAYSSDELDIENCNLHTPLHATQQTVFHLRNSDEKFIMHDEQGNANTGTSTKITTQSINNCANDLYFLTSKVINQLAVNTGLTINGIEAPIYSDWLIGTEELDAIFEDNSKTKEEKDAAFQEHFKYTRGEIASAIMYDMRRIPSDDEPNENYYKSSFNDLDPSAFLNRENYNIVKHLHDNGWLQFRDTTIHFYLGPNQVASYWSFPIEGTAKTMIDTDEDGVVDTEVVLKDCNEPHRVRVTSADSEYYLNITPIENAHKTSQQKTEIPTIKVVDNQLKNVKIPIKEAGQTTKALDKSSGDITNLNNFETDVAFFDLESGVEISTPELKAGNEYTIRLTLKESNGWEYPEDNSSNCRVGYVFITLQVVPNTLVWHPTEASFNGWGKDENWKGWIDNGDGVIDEGELTNGYVPIAGANVVIPKLANTLQYPYIVPDEEGHDHSHYPMTHGFQPHHCSYIYFQPGAHIHNQHLLEYERAYVDMQITPGAWHMVSAPLQKMVSGDMFIPHDGTWDSGQKILETNPFAVREFNGMRHADAAYAFWQQFYNKSILTHYEDGGTRSASAIDFVQTNTLSQEYRLGEGYNLYGLGLEGDSELTIRLPKPDKEYYYFTSTGIQSTNKTSVDRGENNASYKFAFTADKNNPTMEITLTNNESGNKFLFGNPTMAYIDLHQFIADNNSLNTVIHSMRASSWRASSELTMLEDRYLAPMTSVLLETKENAQSITLQLSASHLTLNNMVNAVETADDPSSNAPRRTNERQEASEILTIYALSNNNVARTVLATNPIANDYFQQGEDALFVSSGIETKTDVLSPLNMYTVAEQVPMMADVRQGISSIPLAILAAGGYHTPYMQVAFYLTSNWSRECYFVDHKTGQKIRILDGLVISVEMPLNHEQRYYIEGPDTYQGSNGVVTSTTQPTLSTTGNKVWAYAPDRGNVVVSSTDLIKSATLYDITGRLITSSPLNSHLMTNSLTLHTAGTAGVYIVDVTLRDGSTERAQVIVQ